mgnify:CR=1 FL=1
MSWVAIHNSGKELLSNNNIPYISQEIISPFNITAYFFHENYLEKLRDITNIDYNQKYESRATDYEGRFLLVPKDVVNIEQEEKKENSTDYKVLFYDSVSTKEISDIGMKKFLELTKEIAPVIGKNIKIGIPHNARKTSPKSVNNWFYIFIWSQIEENDFPSVYPPQTMWGHKTNCLDPGFAPSNKGFPIMTDEGYCIAEWVDNALYIHYDICHYSKEESYVVYKMILAELVKIYKMSLKDKELYLELLVEKLKLQEKQNFVKFLLEKNSAKLKEVAGGIKNIDRNIESYQIEIVTQLSKRKDLDITLLSLEKNNNDSALFTSNEYDKISKIKKIKEIKSFRDKIEFHTEHIYIDFKDLKGENVIYDIGKFIIAIYLDGRIRFTNKTNKGCGPGYSVPKGFDGNTDYNRHHPHVNSEGIACLGNISSIAPKYLASNQLGVLLVLLLKFLETVYVEDSAGKGIYWWPKVNIKVI